MCNFIHINHHLILPRNTVSHQPRQQKRSTELQWCIQDPRPPPTALGILGRLWWVSRELQMVPNSEAAARGCLLAQPAAEPHRQVMPRTPLFRPLQHAAATRGSATRGHAAASRVGGCSTAKPSWAAPGRMAQHRPPSSPSCLGLVPFVECSPHCPPSQQLCTTPKHWLSSQAGCSAACRCSLVHTSCACGSSRR